jgi:16S rRNA processing protein RimM
MKLFAIGKIVKTRGLHGCLKVLCYAETKCRLGGVKFVYIGKTPPQESRFDLRKIDVSGKFLFIELKDVLNVESAKEFVGCEVFLPENLLEDLQDGEYYWKDIIGLDVYNEDNEYIGRIESIFPTGSNDVYVCRGGKKEILIPAISDVIKKIDMNRRVMIVKMLEGL